VGQKQLDPKRLVFIDETCAKTNMTPTRGRCGRGLDGPVNGECFLAHVKEVLAPTLSNGDIVLIDNLASHKSPKIRKAIEAKGAALRCLPR
jgi:hypothetical protein